MVAGLAGGHPARLSGASDTMEEPIRGRAVQYREVVAMRASRRGRWAIAVVAMLLAATGCAPVDSGSAAVVGDEQLSDEVLSDWMTELNDVLGRPPEASTPGLIQPVIGEWIFTELTEQAAQTAGIEVTTTEVDLLIADSTALAGSEQGLELALAEISVPPSRTRDYFWTRAAWPLLAESLVGPEASDSEFERALVEELSELSHEEDARISPRYGFWDSDLLVITPDPESVVARTPPDTLLP